MHAHTKFRAGLIGTALAFFLIVQWLTAYPDLVETYYSNGLYPILTLLMSGVSGQFSFSLTEFAVWFSVLILAPALFNSLWHRRTTFSRTLLNLTTLAAIMVVWFYLFWGLNYLRLPLSTKLGLDAVQLEMDAFDSTFVDIIRQADKLNLSYPVIDIPTINDHVEASYSSVLDSLHLKKIPGSRSVKTLVDNWVLNKTTTSGWFSPFFHEVHYNKDLMIIEQPFVIAHEKAHQMGYTNEAEANFLAFLVCTNSEDPLLRYSGYFSVLGYFLSASGGSPERHRFFSDLITDGVKLDLSAVRGRWLSHVGVISKVSRKGYDLYLKANQVKEGRASYSRVVQLIVKYEAGRSSRRP